MIVPTEAIIGLFKLQYAIFSDVYFEAVPVLSFGDPVIFRQCFENKWHLISNEERKSVRLAKTPPTHPLHHPTRPLPYLRRHILQQSALWIQCE